MDQFIIKEIFPVKAIKLYEAWLDSDAHGKIIGADAKIDPEINGLFDIWDGYITGKNLELIKGKKIVQSWRTPEFPENAQDSILELTFIEDKNSTKFILKHTNIPDGQGDEYRQGWTDYYLTSMKKIYN